MQLTKSCHGLANLVQPLCVFRHQTSHRFVIAGDDDLLSFCDTVEKLADGLGGGDGLVRDAAGMLYISDWKNGKLWKLNLKKKGAKPEPYAQTFQASADIGLSRDGKFILVPDMKAGSLAWLPK